VIDLLQGPILELGQRPLCLGKVIEEVDAFIISWCKDSISKELKDLILVPTNQSIVRGTYCHRINGFWTIQDCALGHKVRTILTRCVAQSLKNKRTKETWVLAKSLHDMITSARPSSEADHRTAASQSELQEERKILARQQLQMDNTIRSTTPTSIRKEKETFKKNLPKLKGWFPH